jgi:hypothetical protein
VDVSAGKFWAAVAVLVLMSVLSIGVLVLLTFRA